MACPWVLVGGFRSSGIEAVLRLNEASTAWRLFAVPVRGREGEMRQSGQDYALAASSLEVMPPVDGSLGDTDSDAERELPWEDILPEYGRMLFAEEMSQLMAEAAEARSGRSFARSRPMGHPMRGRCVR